MSAPKNGAYARQGAKKPMRAAKRQVFWKFLVKYRHLKTNGLLLQLAVSYSEHPMVSHTLDCGDMKVWNLSVTVCCAKPNSEALPTLAATPVFNKVRR